MRKPMTRNEALEKIESYIYDNFPDVSAPVYVVARDLLNFIEDELKMNHVKEISVPTHSEYVYQRVKTFGWD
jgi:hypothetical protein